MPLAPDHHDLASRRLNRAPSSFPSSIVASSALARTDPTAFSTRLKPVLAVTAGGWMRDSAGYSEQLSASRVDAEIDSALCLGTADMTALATTGTVILRVDLLRSFFQCLIFSFLVTLIPCSHPVSRILNSHQVVPSDMDRCPLARVTVVLVFCGFHPVTFRCRSLPILDINHLRHATVNRSCPSSRHRLKVPGWHSAQPFGRAAVRRADCVGLSAGTGMGGTPVRVWTWARMETSQDALVQCGRT
ncbi:hypothetical protein B0H13DRAFT_2309608 [Mycena leptocephala]|nr:hypothetical protein B0H13DRAFT_2309608 [Mycena leptocephala]